MHTLKQLLEGARLHGENSDPDHEVGDLQDLLRACWENMTTKQQDAVFASEIGQACLMEDDDQYQRT